MGRRFISIVLSILLFSFVFCYIYIRGSDELKIQRLVQSKTQSEQSIILVLENHGLRDIELIKVSINKSKPDHNEISLSNSLPAIQAASEDDDHSNIRDKDSETKTKNKIKRKDRQYERHK